MLTNRYAEYALTGGFFWITQISTAYILWGGESELIFRTIYDPWAPFLESKIAAAVMLPLFTALTIVLLFVTGLLLDLSSSYFRQIEKSVFAVHLSNQREWFSRFINKNATFLGDDYERIKALFEYLSVKRQVSIGIQMFKIWNFKRWRQNNRSAFAHLRANREYASLHALISAYVFYNSDPSRISTLLEQHFRWKTARAIAMSLLIIGIEIWWGSVTSLLYGGVAFVFLVIQISSLMLAVALTYLTYWRYAETLMAFAYVVFDQSRGSDARSPDRVSQ